MVKASANIFMRIRQKRIFNWLWRNTQYRCLVIKRWRYNVCFRTDDSPGTVVARTEY